jgi:aryl-alcohol dehydrogenase-like predicted oxidoreductase
MFNRWIEEGLLEVLAAEGIGCIAFSPLAQGLLAGRYLDGIPDDSRAASPHGFLGVKGSPKNGESALPQRNRRRGARPWPR